MEHADTTGKKKMAAGSVLIRKAIITLTGQNTAIIATNTKKDLSNSAGNVIGRIKVMAV